MLDTDTKRRIDTARDILVGKVPDPKSQVEQITIALIYKFMDDMDLEAEELGGSRKFFANGYARYCWARLMRSGLGGHEILNLYAEAIAKMPENPGIPPLFRDIFKNAFLPYRDPETLRAFLKIIDEFEYDHSERLGDAFEYLLSVLGSQGDAGQFRTPRHIIDFIVEIVDPKKSDVILDPACGTAGFLISAYKHILRANTSGCARCPTPSPPAPLPEGEGSKHYRGGFGFAGLKQRARELRRKQTDAEALLWELLRDRQLCDAKFRRQHQIGDYICDFYCHEADLVVECDGDVHQTIERRQFDAKRDAYLKAQGITVLRFLNSQVQKDTDSVLDAIAQRLLPPPSPLGRGAGGEGIGTPGDLLTPDERGRLARNVKGYDISPDMVRLSLVNLYLHGFTDPHIYEYDTLTSEDRWNEYADVILANPPFMSPKGGIKPHNRFSVQSKRSEVLFVDYMAEHLTPSGRAGIIVPEGIIFQSQTAYRQLRKMLVEEYLVAVVSLPAGVFNPYSGVKTSILVLDKALAKQTDRIAFFKIENDGFNLGAQRRPIDKNDLRQARAEIAEYLRRLRARESVEDLQPALGLVVPKEKIAENEDYNLSGERYRENGQRFSQFPHVRLGEVVEVLDSLRRPITKHDRKPGPYPYYGATGVLDYVEGFVFDEPLVLVGEDGAKWGPGEKSAFPVEGKIWVNNHAHVLRSKRDRLLDRFLIEILNQADLMPYITGVTVPKLNQANLRSIEIPLPPLEVQKEIVAEIEGYQKVIDGARAVLDNYRPHIPIHPDWPMVRLEDVCSSIQNGYPVEQKDEPGRIKVTRIQTIADGTVDLEKTKWTDDSVPDDRIMRAGDVLFSHINSIDHLAKTALFLGAPVPVVHGINLIRLQPRGDVVEPSFLLWSLKQDGFVEKAKTFAQRAVNQASIKVTDIRAMDIALPPLETQRAIVAEIEAEQALVAANRELITRFERKIQAALARVWGES